MSDYVCRMLAHMDAKGVQSVTPRLRPGKESMPARPWIEAENLSMGYIQRPMHLLPRQGDREPWTMSQDYYIDRKALPVTDMDDGMLQFV